MNLNIIKEKIEYIFVEYYKELKEFMNNINKLLKQLKIDERYILYDNFCLDIELHVLSVFKNKNINYSNITSSILVNALNNMIKYKIMKDPNYEKKIMKNFKNYESILTEIKNLKII